MATRLTWRCFFCGELFTHKDKAAQHFGVFEADEPACKLMPYQEKVLKYIRDLESEVRTLMAERHDESHPLLASVYDIQHEMASRERTAEERGYSKGVADMQKQGYCVEPQKHD